MRAIHWREEYTTKTMFVLREQECLVGVVSIGQKARADVEPTTRHLIGEYHHLALLAHAEQAGYNLSPQP